MFSVDGYIIMYCSIQFILWVIELAKILASHLVSLRYQIHFHTQTLLLILGLQLFLRLLHLTRFHHHSSNHNTIGVIFEKIHFLLIRNQCRIY